MHGGIILTKGEEEKNLAYGPIKGSTRDPRGPQKAQFVSAMMAAAASRESNCTCNHLPHSLKPANTFERKF